MNLNKKESESSLSLKSMLSNSGGNITSLNNSIDIINNNFLAQVENEDSSKQKNNIDTTSKKKYKKNLIWDGPRWDLAHFDPSMSARERKKLIYYETLFNKLESNSFVLKCNENASNTNKQIGTRGKKGRSNAIRSSTNTFNSENKYKEENKKDDLTKDVRSQLDSEGTNERDILNDSVEYSIRNSFTPCRDGKLSNYENSIDNFGEHHRSDNFVCNTTAEGENSNIRRYHDWRIKLLSKAGSLQMTPSRVQKLQNS